MSRIAATWLATGWMAASGCAGQPPVDAAHASVAPGERMGGATMAKGDASTEDMEALALKIAVANLSVSPDALTVVRIEPVEWRDSSLGCPQGDFNYLSVITPGHLALVRDDSGTMHRVHMTNGRGFVCKKPTTKAKPDTPLPRPNFNQRQLEALSRADLAARLSVPPSDISVVRSRAVDWPDAALRCVADDAATTSNPSKGFVITLAHRGREYTYHSDTRQVTPCPAIESQ